MSTGQPNFDEVGKMYKQLEKETVGLSIEQLEEILKQMNIQLEDTEAASAASIKLELEIKALKEIIKKRKESKK